MSRSLAWSVLLALLLGGCERDVAPAARVAPVLPNDGRIEWHGLLACADCNGIQVHLVLLRSGDLRTYTLTETFLADGGATRFVEGGRWQRDSGLLQLDGEAGSTRVLAVLPDGRLQPRDQRGRALSRRDGDFLAPVTPANAP